MTLLDRLRSPSRQKHPDAAVRLAYVTELPLTERDLIVAAAREDEDARVRRAAVAKLLDPAVLAAIVREDADAGVREDALGMLRDVALDAFEGVSEADSLAAVDSLSDERTLVLIAKTSAREAVGLRALGRLDQAPHAHVFGSIARQAPVEVVRQAALTRVHERADVLAVAINSEFKDVAVAAADRLAERDDLEQVAARAKNKGAAKRASAVLRERDDRAAREAALAAAAEVQDMSVEMPVETVAETIVTEQEMEAARLRAEQDAEAARVAEEERQRELALSDERARAAAEAEKAAEQAAAEQKALADAEAAREVERRRQASDAEARERREGLNRINQLLGRAEALAQKPELSLKTAARVLRDVKAALADVPPLPSRHDYDEAVHRLKAAQAALTPKVQDLREVAEWQQWANIGIQEQLCEKMEALRTVEDAESVARRIRELQDQWRQAADVPRPQGEALWRRFKAIHDELWARCEAHFAEQAGARSENLAKKAVLCERAEALSDSTNWLATADAIKALQAEWKTIGPVTRGQEKAVWERFRAACDRFFTRRQDDLAKRKAIWAENFARKEALCVAVEALVGSTDWDRTAAEIRRLQTEWKSIGPVKKSRSEAIWQRFRAACDAFFVRHAQRHDVARAERLAAREAICAEAEGLMPQAPDEGESTTATAPEGLAATVRALRGRWQQEIAARGVEREQAFALDRRFADAVGRVIARWPAAFAGTEMDPDANRRQLEALVTRMETLAASLKGNADNAAVSPTTKLAAMLKEALAANTIGGKVDVESRKRAAQEDVRQAQASWSRVGPVADQARRPLAERFQRAIKRISEAS